MGPGHLVISHTNMRTLNYAVCSFMLISDLITDLIPDFGIASMLNHTINLILVTKFMVWFNMKAIPKFDKTDYMDQAYIFDT